MQDEASRSAQRIEELKQQVEQYNAAMSLAMGEQPQNDEKRTTATAFPEEEQLPNKVQNSEMLVLLNALRSDRRRNIPSTSSDVQDIFFKEEERASRGSSIVEEQRDSTNDVGQQHVSEDSDVHFVEEEIPTGEWETHRSVAQDVEKGHSDEVDEHLQVERCLEKELDLALSSRHETPINEASQPPPLRLHDLETAFHRIEALEQSAQILESFGIQRTKLPYTDRISSLRTRRAGLLSQESILSQTMAEDTATSLTLDEESDSVTGAITSLLQECSAAQKGFSLIYDKKNSILRKEQELEAKGQEMQREFFNLQSRKQQLASLMVNVEHKTKVLAKKESEFSSRRSEMEGRRALSDDKTTKVKDLEAKVQSWLNILEERDAELTRKEGRIRVLEAEISRRRSGVSVQKEIVQVARRRDKSRSFEQQPEAATTNIFQRIREPIDRD